jgi:hypothetical protein
MYVTEHRTRHCHTCVHSQILPRVLCSRKPNFTAPTPHHRRRHLPPSRCVRVPPYITLNFLSSSHTSESLRQGRNRTWTTPRLCHCEAIAPCLIRSVPRKGDGKAALFRVSGRTTGWAFRLPTQQRSASRSPVGRCESPSTSTTTPTSVLGWRAGQPPRCSLWGCW